MTTTTDYTESTIPNSLEAETCVLAAIFLDGKCLDDVRGILTPESFFQPDHKIIFTSMLAVSDSGSPPNPVHVAQHLVTRGLFREVGGGETIRRLAFETQFTSAFAGRDARIVAESAKLRELIRTCAETTRQCYAPKLAVESAERIAANLEAAASRIREIGWADSIQSLEAIMTRVIESKETQAIERYKTGLAELDELCGGIPIGLMTLVAGKASMGKSMWCKQVARNVAAEGFIVGIIAIEENAQKIGENYLSAFSGVENSKIVYNRLTREDWTEMLATAPKAATHKIFIDDAQQKLSDIERTMRRMVRKYGCQMIVVDHLHLIDAEMDSNRVQQITKISGGLKRTIKELNIAGIVAAQMNRGGANDQDSPPELWHLRDSGSLEQDGDLIIQLHRQDYYDWKKKGSDFVPDHRLRMYVNKNKGGGVGWRDAYFNGDTQTVSNWTVDPFGGHI